MKKLFALILVLSMVLSMVPAFAENPVAPVAETHQHTKGTFVGTEEKGHYWWCAEEDNYWTYDGTTWLTGGGTYGHTYDCTGKCTQANCQGTTTDASLMAAHTPGEWVDNGSGTYHVIYCTVEGCEYYTGSQTALAWHAVDANTPYTAGCNNVQVECEATTFTENVSGLNIAACDVQKTGSAELHAYNGTVSAETTKGAAATCYADAKCSYCGEDVTGTKTTAHTDPNGVNGWLEDGTQFVVTEPKSGWHTYKCQVQECGVGYGTSWECTYAWYAENGMHIQKCKFCFDKVAEHAPDFVLQADGETIACSGCNVPAPGSMTGCTHPASAYELIPGYAISCADVADSDGNYGRNGMTDGLKCGICGVVVEERKVIENKNHIAATEVIEQAATCKVPGKKYVTCTACGFKSYVEIPTSTAHAWKEVGVVEGCADGCHVADCTQNAYSHFVCTVAGCGEVKHEEIKNSKLAHNYSKVVYGNVIDGVFTDVGADCMKDMYSVKKCTNKNANGTTCGVETAPEKLTKLPYDKHHYGAAKTVAPTCTTPGGTKKACENLGCDEVTWTDGPWYLNAEGAKVSTPGTHVVSDDYKVVEAATCFAKGKAYYTCTVPNCGAKLDAAGNILEEGKYVELNKLTHTNEVLPESVATMTDADLHTWYAMSTLEGNDYKIVYNDHVILKYTPATCLTQGYWETSCETCGQNYRKITNADCTICNKVEHEWTYGNVVTPAVCGEKDGSAQVVCKVCKTVAKHTAEDAGTCICADMGDHVHESSMHTAANVGELKGKNILWTIEATDADKAHDYKVTSKTYKAPTCHAEGQGWMTCSRCGKETWFETIPALTKAATGWEWIKVYAPADCELPGRYIQLCSVCGEKNADYDSDGYKTITKADGTEEYPALGHNWKNAGSAKICGYNHVAKYVCSRCNEVSYKGYADGTYDYVDIPVATDGHTMSKTTFDVAQYSANYMKEFKWVTPVTCTADGYFVVGACVKCDYVAEDAYTAEVGAQHLDEQRDEASKLNTAANCVDPEYQAYKCTVCEKVYTKAVGTKVSKPWTDKATKDGGSHKNWGVVEYLVEETCTEDGLGFYGCTACGTKKATAETVHAAHNWSKELQVVVAATCGKAGVGQKVCLDCGTVNHEYDVIDATGKHAYGKITHASKDCTEIGYVVWECLVCGADDEHVDVAGYEYITDATNGILQGRMEVDTTIYSVNEATGMIVETPDTKEVKNIVQVLPAGDHIPGTATVRPATCTLAGGLRSTCTVCGVEIVNRTDSAALGHDIVRTATEPTCYVAGYETYSCVRCNEVLSKGALTPLNHNFVDDDNDGEYDGDYKNDGVTYWKGLKKSANKADHIAATCHTNGYTKFVCTEEGCGYSETKVEPYDEYNHKNVIDLVVREATCTVNGAAIASCEYCDADNRIIPIPAEHKMEVVDTKVAATCTNTGIDNVKCSVCGATGTKTTKALGHTLVTKEVAASCEETAGLLTYCSVCSYKTKFVKTGETALDHKWGDKVFVAATCEKDAHYETTCLRGCGKVAITKILEGEPKYQEAYKHANWEELEDLEFKGNCLEKSYKVYYCSICKQNIKVEGTVVANAHAWEITGTYANKVVNCGNPGYADVKCKVCDITKTMQYITPDHSWSSYIITDSIAYKLCLVCGEMDIVWNDGTFGGYKGCTTYTLVNNVPTLVGKHTGLVVNASKEATCTEAGELGHIECTTCGTVIQQGGVIPAHTKVEIPAVAPTCTEVGYTAGTKCLVCNEYVVAPVEVPAAGHKYVEVPAKAPTATEAGYTAGSKCEVCGEWEEGKESTPVAKLNGSLLRCAVLRESAELLGKLVVVLPQTTEITITGELVNGFYPVVTAEGTGYIHNSYIKVA
ncbi:MAG: SH3 domain-containing protein [Clostridia bacterium]|nr:SH3 domain-containing protein [Clostridia bacterium]